MKCSCQFLLLFILFGFSSALTAQVQNDDRLNILFESVSVRPGQDDIDCWDEPTGGGVCADTDEEWNVQIELGTNSSCTGSTYGDVPVYHFFGDNRPTAAIPFLLESQLNTLDYNYTGKWQLSEMDAGSGDPGGGIPYIDKACLNLTIDPGVLLNQWNSGSSNTSMENHQLNYRSIHRYTNGEDLNNPLEFGVLTAPSVKTHINTTAGQPSGLNANFGYQNTYSTGSYPNLTSQRDVIYTFVLNECLRVEVNNNSTPDVDLKLFKQGGSITTLTFIHNVTDGTTDVLDLQAGTYVIIAEKPSSAGLDYFAFILTTTDVPAATPGSISLDGPSSIEINTNHPGGLLNTTSASNHESYQWEIKNSGSSTWVPITNETSATLTLGVLTGSAFYRRAAINACGDESFTNEIEVKALTANADVQGKVTAPSGIGIEDITITITNLQSIEGITGTISHQATTGSDGTYAFPSFYVGPDARNWGITPSFPSHNFSPTSRTISLSHSLNQKLNQDFVDLTTVTFSGKVKHDFMSSSCGLEGVSIFLNGSYNTNTDATGNYNISNLNIGNHTVEAVYEDHTFLPDEITMTVTGNVTGQDFTDQKMETVNLSLLVGCNKYGGTADIRFTDALACIDVTYTTSTAGFLSVTLPAKEYNVEVTGFDPISTSPIFDETAVIAYFSPHSINIDLTTADTTLALIYHPAPSVTVSGISDPPGCGFAYPVVEQFVAKELTVDLWDYAPDVLTLGDAGCRLDTGYVAIDNVIGSQTNNGIADTIYSSGQPISFVLIPGTPSLSPPYIKNISLFARDNAGRGSSTSHDMFVQGVRPRIGTFTTVSPEIPFLIVHDPPGDLSYSEIIQGTITERTSSMSASMGGGVEVWTRGTVNPFGAFWGSIESTLSMSAEAKSTTESATKMEFTQTYGTSQSEDPKQTYSEGDRYIGAALNILYSVNDLVRFDSARCEVLRDNKLMISPDTFTTVYDYSHNFIRDQIIPNLRDFLANGVTDPDSVKFFEDQAAIWEHTLLTNEKNKASTPFPNPAISFNGGGPQSNTETTTSTTTITNEWSTSIGYEVAGEMGFFVPLVGGVAGGIRANMRMDFGGENTNTSSQSLSTYWLMDDSEADDLYTVKVGKDFIYGTPVFNLIAAETSCPYLPGTLPRYDASLTVDQAIHTQIPANDQVIFKFTLFNQSQSNDDLPYTMILNPASNPDGLVIVGGNTNGVWPFMTPIPYNSSVQQTVVLERGPGNVYTYEDLEFNIYPDCGGTINTTYLDPIATQKISIYFDAPCSDVTIASPVDGWVASQNSGNAVPIKVTDYDVNGMDALSIEYSVRGSNSWAQAISIPLASLNSNPSIGSTYSWSTALVDDGEYSIRAKITCGSDIMYTPQINGLIDQNYPVVYGRHAPEDHQLDLAADVIGTQFNEAINCAAINNNNVHLINSITRIPYDISIVCAGKGMIIDPVVDLLNLLPADYTIIMTEVEDIYGNVNPDTISWQFSSGQYDEYACNESTIFYVDQSAIYGARNGENWEDAYIDLRTALMRACPGSSIYVAEGSYMPSDSFRTLDIFGNVILNLDTVQTDHVHFNGTHGYNIIGGFPAGGANIEMRDPVNYPTILSGDNNHNQIADAGDAHTILYMNSLMGELTMDGFIFEYGYADGTGALHTNRAAGIFNIGNAHFKNCVFRFLSLVDGTLRSGGAILNHTDGNLKLTNSLFHDNSAGFNGGAVYTISSSNSLTVENCSFVQNHCTHPTQGNGGGLSVEGIAVTINNSIFAENTAASNNNLVAHAGGSLLVSNTLFDGALPANITGSNNLVNTDPMFIDAASNNFQLQSASMAIENGDNTFLASDNLVDLNEQPRVVDVSFSSSPTVDMGAYEYSPCGSTAGATAIYVDANATVGNDGTSWAQAVSTLSSALVIAKTCGIDSIYVASGMYFPDVTSEVDDRDASFTIAPNMKILGGFPTGGGAMTDRNWRDNQTILSGDIGLTGDDTDNSYSVIRMKNVGNNVVLDGFIIFGGYANGVTTESQKSGGGIFIEADGQYKYSSPTINNCALGLNFAITGGGINVSSSNRGAANPIISNCEFGSNISENGGAIAESVNDKFSLINSRVLNTLFIENVASQNGGALYVTSTGSGQIFSKYINCTLVSNLADFDQSGGGLGGAAFIDSASIGQINHEYVNSIFWSNQAGAIADQVTLNGSNASAKLRFSVFEDDVIGGGLMLPAQLEDGGNNSDEAPQFIDPIGGNYQLAYGSVAINSGSNIANFTGVDLLGNLRIIGSAIDVGSYEFDFNFPCGQYGTLMIDDNPVFGAEYKASGLITSNGKVTAASNGPVDYTSEAAIELLEGFEVMLGQEFIAEIENPCVD